MPFIKIKYLATSLFLFFAFSVTAAAQEAASAIEGTQSTQTPGAEAKAGGADESNSNSDREWAKRKTKLNILETKMKDLTKQLQHLIHVKNTGGAAVDEKGKPIDVLATIASAHKKLKETVVEYNAEKAELKYRFPEEGARIERRYVPLRVQSLEQIEKDSGLDGELTRTKNKIEKKYATFVGDELAKPPPQQTPKIESTLKDKNQGLETESQRIKLSQ